MNLRSALVLALLALPASAQAVHVVDASGGGTFLDVQSAVSAAASGDLVVIRPGPYDGFALKGKGLTLVAEGAWPASITGATSIEDVPPGAEVVLSGLRFDPVDGLPHALRIADTQGLVLLQDVQLTGGPALPRLEVGVVVEDAAAVTFVDSKLDRSWTHAISDGPNEALRVVHSNVFLHGTEVNGTLGTELYLPPIPPGTAGGTGISLAGGSLFLSGSSIVGGRGGENLGFAVPPTVGGAGLTVDQDGEVLAHDSTIVGGPGGHLPSGQQGPDGADVVVLSGTVESSTEPRARELRSAPTLPDTFEIVGKELDLAWHMVAFDAAPTVFYEPLLHGAIHLGGMPAYLHHVGTLDATGELAIPVTLGALGTDYVGMYHQVIVTNLDEPELVLSDPRHVALLSATAP